MEPLPTSPLGQRLCELFPYRWNWLEGSTQDSTAPKWATNTKYPLKPRVLWTRHQDASTLVGVRFGRSTRYGLVDIDADSPYLDRLDLVRAALETIGICSTITIRSSWNGGFHIYCPLPKAYPTFSVACALTMALEAQGLEIKGGALEVFPNTKAYTKFWLGEFSNYNGHRLPLQPGSGSCILSEQGEPITLPMGPGGTDLARFFAMWDNALIHQDSEALEQALATARNNRRHRPRAVGPVADWRKDLEQVLAEGWTGPGQTNHLLKEIACFGRVFEGLGGVELAQYVETTATSRPGYAQHCQHQHEIWRRACVWAAAAEKYYWPLGSEPLRERRSLVEVVQCRANDARSRIQQAAKQVQATGLAIRELAAQLCAVAHCSQATLYKNLDLWHPHHHTEAPNQPNPKERPVTAQPERLTAPMMDILKQIRQSLESADMRAVTGLGGENERCSPDFPPKNLPLGGRGGVARGGGGLSTGPEGASHA